VENFDFREKLFKEVTHAGFISLEQWVSWATEHISGKVGKLPKVHFSNSLPRYFIPF
jgi:hypothetical protein